MIGKKFSMFQRFKDGFLLTSDWNNKEQQKCEGFYFRS